MKLKVGTMMFMEDYLKRLQEAIDEIEAKKKGQS